MDVYAPVHAITVNSPIFAPWFTSELKDSKHRIRVLYKRYQRNKRFSDLLKYHSERDLHRNNLNLARNKYYSSRLKGFTCGAMGRELRKLGLLKDSGTRALAVDAAQLNKAFVAFSQATVQHFHLLPAIELGMQTEFCFSEISTADVLSTKKRRCWGGWAFKESAVMTPTHDSGPC